MILLVFIWLFVGISGHETEHSQEVQTKSIWLACYLNTYVFIKTGNSEILDFSKELNQDCKSVVLNIVTSVMGECTKSLDFTSSEEILITDLNKLEENIREYNKKNNVFKREMERLRKEGVELDDEKKRIHQEMINRSDEFKKLINSSYMCLGTVSEFLVCAGAAGLAAFGLPIALGFGGAGIAAGSAAAAVQAFIGNVAAGSTFAILTSLGMKGILLKATIASFTAATAGLYGILSGQECSIN